MFGRSRWPVVSLEDADLFANLLDAAASAAPADAGPPLRELVRLARLGPEHPERTLWQWCAAWSAACDELDEHVLALKIAVFVRSWTETAEHPVAASLGSPLPAERAAVDEAAIAAAAKVDDFVAVRRREASRIPAFTDTLTAERRNFIDHRYAFHWDTMTDFLTPGEVVREACPVLLPNLRVAMLALTDDRLLIARGNAFGFLEPTCVLIDLEHVLTARYSMGRFRDAHGFKDMVHKAHELVVESRTGTFSVSFGVRGTPGSEGSRWPNLILDRQGRKSGPPATGGLAAELEKLAVLHRQGLLTATEYQAAKARVLGS